MPLAPASCLLWALLAEDALAADDGVGAYAFARTGYHRGLDALRRAIRERAGEPGEAVLSMARHIRLARETASALRNASRAMRDGLPLDLCAVDLNQALQSLGAITGENVSEALLDEVFSTFCVGK